MRLCSPSSDSERFESRADDLGRREAQSDREGFSASLAPSTRSLLAKSPPTVVRMTLEEDQQKNDGSLLSQLRAK